jgi:hypothetical protein
MVTSSPIDGPRWPVEDRPADGTPCVWAAGQIAFTRTG